MNKVEHIATIDFCYWRIGKLNELISKPKSSIERLVDNACGYNEEEEVKKECISLMEQIIESKKAIGADYSRDDKFLDKLKSKLYNCTFFGRSFLIGWFSHADKWYHKFSIIY